MDELKKGLTNIKMAVDVRAKITKMYSEYNIISNQVTLETDITRADFKRAVDALYYLGGGWPHANSKGRLETMLDNFAAVLRILDFAGSAHVIHDHLAKHGITVKLSKSEQIKKHKLDHTPPDLFSSPANNQDLVHQAITLCMSLQKEICENADVIKYSLKPGAKKSLMVEDEEYDRLFGAMRLKTTGERGSEKLRQRQKVVTSSVHNFETAIDIAAKERLVMVPPPN